MIGWCSDTLTLFDREVRDILNVSVATSKFGRKCENVGNTNEYPLEFNDLLDTKYAFKVIVVNSIP
ncbi:hypothetical protein LXL04_029081 [Taraxacum kok-saghyz]